MKRVSVFLICVCFAALRLSGQSFLPPTIKSKTSFAIVTDSASWLEARDEIRAYRQAIENDGLGTYLIARKWTCPDEIRDLLIALHRDKKSPLEGVVFVGDIPIPMLRDAQHLTSAFKMDQKRNRQSSSVASDRFYDDFGLRFDSIGQDSLQPLFFYYSLRADSKQRLRPDIYSARIKPLEKAGKGKYVQLREYLRKVVAVRTTEKDNAVDNLTVARGHGYNSESRVAWSGEQLALKEQFPRLFAAGGFVKFMDFDSYWPMKPYWLNEIQRPDLDIMLFHHHGSNDLQYVNGYPSGSDVTTSKENIRRYLRSKIRAAVEKGKDREETIEHYRKQLDVPRSWCEEAFDPEKVALDSVVNAQLDIRVADILSLRPNARFVLFDACYNGSFYEDEYIAGAYIFNEGKTIVAQGNTVNVIQDKWADEYLGLLACGLRVGEWSKLTHFLETHLIGDPTFRFAKTCDPGFDLQTALTLEKNRPSFWKKRLSHPNVDVQAIALRMLYENGGNGVSTLLKQTYLNSESLIVRLEALQLLSRLNNDDFVEVLSYAVSDSYELTRRYAVQYSTKNGSASLLPALARSMLNDDASKRINFKRSEGYRLVDVDKLETVLKSQAADRPFYDRKSLDKYGEVFERARQNRAKSLSILTDKSEKTKTLAFEIARYRNQPASDDAPVLLNIVSDSGYDASLRLASAEALGWFRYSYRKNEIVDRLREIRPTVENPAISNEIKKTINRLVAN